MAVGPAQKLRQQFRRHELYASPPGEHHGKDAPGARRPRSTVSGRISRGNVPWDSEELVMGGAERWSWTDFGRNGRDFRSDSARVRVLTEPSRQGNTDR